MDDTDHDAGDDADDYDHYDDDYDEDHNDDYDHDSHDDDKPPLLPHWRFFFPIHVFLGKGSSSLLVTIIQIIISMVSNDQNNDQMMDK